MAMNEFDPRLKVVVVDLTPGVPPDTLVYNERDLHKTPTHVPPEFDSCGDPCYEVPRFYAERLLQNAGGRTFRLVSPFELTIRANNGRGGYQLVKVRAWKRRPGGEWTELTEEEVAISRQAKLIVETPSVNPEAIAAAVSQAPATKKRAASRKKGAEVVDPATASVPSISEVDVAPGADDEDSGSEPSPEITLEDLIQ
jgi:hypothetical protein